MTDDLPGAAPLDGELSPADAALVSGALSSVPYLDPRSDLPGEPMPEQVWERLSASWSSLPAPATEPVPSAPSAPAASTAPAAAAPVVALASQRRRTTLLSGLVAAGVAVIAVGVGVTVLQPAATPVAGEAIQKAPPSDGPPVGAAAPAPVAAVPSSQAQADTAAPESSAPLALAAPAPAGRSMIMPTRVLTSTGTPYTAAQLDEQVGSLLATVQAQSPEQAAAMPTPTALDPVGSDGVTSNMASLRDCITGLMHSASATALVVDRSSFDGGDAAIIVMPGATSVDVYVVAPDCSAAAPDVLHHVLHAWTGTGN